VASGYRIELKNTQNNSTAYAITDSAGSASGAVPPNVSLEMKVYNRCNTLVHTQAIGPFATNTDMGAVTITIPAPASITVSGTVKKCDLSAVTSGYADVIIDGSYYRTAINNGIFSITIQRCGNAATTAQVIATDIQANQQSTSSSLNVTAGSYSAGEIIACGVSTAEYINFIIGGNPQSFLSPVDSFTTYRQSTTTNISAYSRNYTDSISWQYTSLSFSGVTAPGTYSFGSNTFIVTKGIYPAAGSREYNLDAATTITITEFGNTGQYIAGSFSGTMRERYTNVLVTGTCNFRVRRGF
jgi:hypothetical protein